MILAINTSTPQFGIALMGKNGTVHARILIPREKGRFGTLVPTLNLIFKESDRSLADITAVALTTGPGSFTGLRVGLSLAKGLVSALDLPLVGISTMAAMANAAPLTHLPVAPILHSRKNEVFTALFTWNKDRVLVRAGEDICVRIKDLPDVFKDPTLFVGNDFDAQRPLIKACLAERAVFASPHHWELDPVQVGLLALKRLNVKDVDNPSTLMPLYMRPPDIRPNPFPLLPQSSQTGSIYPGYPVDNYLQKR